MIGEISRTYYNSNFENVFPDKYFTSPYNYNQNFENKPSKTPFEKYHLSKSNFTSFVKEDEVKKLDIYEFMYNWHNKKSNYFQSSIYLIG